MLLTVNILIQVISFILGAFLITKLILVCIRHCKAKQHLRHQKFDQEGAILQTKETCTSTDSPIDTKPIDEENPDKNAKKLGGCGCDEVHIEIEINSEENRKNKGLYINEGKSSEIHDIRAQDRTSLLQAKENRSEQVNMETMETNSGLLEDQKTKGLKYVFEESPKESDKEKVDGNEGIKVEENKKIVHNKNQEEVLLSRQINIFKEQKKLRRQIR